MENGRPHPDFTHVDDRRQRAEGLALAAGSRVPTSEQRLLGLLFADRDGTFQGGFSALLYIFDVSPGAICAELRARGVRVPDLEPVPFVPRHAAGDG